jgi:hypothetical protein
MVSQTTAGLEAATDSGEVISAMYEHWLKQSQHRGGGGGGQQQFWSAANNPIGLPGAGCKKSGPPFFHLMVVM